MDLGPGCASEPSECVVFGVSCVAMSSVSIDFYRSSVTSNGCIRDLLATGTLRPWAEYQNRSSSELSDSFDTPFLPASLVTAIASRNQGFVENLL